MNPNSRPARAGGPDPARRDFLRTLLAAPMMAALAGCGGEAGGRVGMDETLRRVAAYHREHGALPPNPVSVAWDAAVTSYPRIHQPESFTSNRSPVYPLVARALMLLHPENPENPLGNLIRPGDTVVIKPNWCTQHKFPFPITHPSVVVPLVEFALRAGAARVNVIEAPMTLPRGAGWFWSSVFLGTPELKQLIAERHGGAEVNFIDGNADDFLWVDVGEASELREYDLLALDHDGHTGFENNMFFNVPDCRGYNPGKYRKGLAAIARSFLDCDVFINAPKLKTHGYTGITVALKNLMGLNVRSTIHRMEPEILRAYEERPDIAECRESPLRDIPHFDRAKLGDWKWGQWGCAETNYYAGPGNDVLWRTLADLNKIIRCAAPDGTLQREPVRRCLTVVDGIVGTDRTGPITNSLVRSGCVVAGRDPVAVDAVCAYIMGWDPLALNLITNCSRCDPLPIGTMEGFLEGVVGENLDSPCFAQRYEPPTTYSEEVLALHNLKLFRT